MANGQQPCRRPSIDQLQATLPQGNDAHQHIEAEQNGHHSADDIFKCIFIFMNENIWFPNEVSF